MSPGEALTAVFGQHGSLNPGQECARAALILFCGWAMIRTLGRRAFGRWSALDIVVSIIVGSNLSRALTGSAPLWGTLLATIVIFALHQLVAIACASHPRISHFVEGASIKLVEGGRVVEGAFLRHGVSEADLNQALRQAGLDEPGQARLITLEPSGKITVIRASAA
jgi:uncharacterized membrane protein YcaP (DUF421 family)